MGLVESREKDPQPKVSVEFYGTMHFPLNIQSAQRANLALDAGLISSTGRKIVFLEASGNYLVHSQAESVQKAIREEGILPYLMRGWLINEYGRAATPTEARKRIEMISQKGLKESLQTGIIPVTIEDYCSFSGLQALSEKHKFNLEFESHSKETVTRLEKGNPLGGELRHNAVKRWEDGKFDEALDNYKKYHQLQIKRDLMREEEIVEHLRTKIKGLSQEKDGGFLFVLFGSAHLPMAEKIKQINTKTPVKTILAGTVHDFAGEEIDSRLRKREGVLDEFYARQLLFMFILDKTYATTDKSKMIDLGNRFDDFMNNLHQIISNLPLSQIREICEQKMSASDFLLDFLPHAFKIQ